MRIVMIGACRKSRNWHRSSSASVPIRGSILRCSRPRPRSTSGRPPRDAAPGMDAYAYAISFGAEGPEHPSKEEKFNVRLVRGGAVKEQAG